jgi:hypothetical protein
LLVAALVLAFAGEAAAIEFENSRFRRASADAPAMLEAWEKGRSSARASAFFLANRDRRLLVMTASHVVGRNPVFRYRGRFATSAVPVLRDGDFAVYEVSFGAGVSYGTVRTFHIARSRPAVGQGLRVVGYPKGFDGVLMESTGCKLLPRTQLLHPTYFSCEDLDRWCRYAEAANKSRTTCLADAEDRRRGRVRQCELPLAKRETRHQRHRESTHAMNCAVRLGNSGGPVILAGASDGRAVLGMPSMVFARVEGPFPPDLGAGVAVFSDAFKARAASLGIEVR